MIIDVQSLKSILQMETDNSLDDLINSLIPEVQKDIVNYCKNSFINANVQIISSTISFEADGTIADSDEGFLDAYFFDGVDLKIAGSLLNDGIINIESVTAGVLTPSQYPIVQTIRPETAGNIITATMVDFKKVSKFKVAMLFKYYLAREGKLVNSESLPGGYSGNFKNDLEIWKPFNQYRKLYK